MKAARVHRFGPPDVIQVEDIDTPEPAAGEVLVRVAVAGVGPGIRGFAPARASSRSRCR